MTLFQSNSLPDIVVPKFVKQKSSPFSLNSLCKPIKHHCHFAFFSKALLDTQPMSKEGKLQAARRGGPVGRFVIDLAPPSVFFVVMDHRDNPSVSQVGTLWILSLPLKNGRAVVMACLIFARGGQVGNAFSLPAVSPFWRYVICADSIKTQHRAPKLALRWTTLSPGWVEAL